MQAKKVAILQSNYMPWRGYFSVINDVDLFIFYDEVKYTKNDWRNRNIIAGRNGLHWITIPIAKTAVRNRISEVKIENSDWQEKHLRSIAQAYSGFPFFHQLEGLLGQVYEAAKWSYLSELNQWSLRYICEMCGFKTKFVNSKNLKLDGNRVERLVNLLQQVGATHYLSGPTAKDYLAPQEHLFSEAGIELSYKDYAAMPAYPSPPSDDKGALSIIDLLARVPVLQVRDFL